MHYRALDGGPESWVGMAEGWIGIHDSVDCESVLSETLNGWNLEMGMKDYGRFSRGFESMLIGENQEPRPVEVKGATAPVTPQLLNPCTRPRRYWVAKILIRRDSSSLRSEILPSSVIHHYRTRRSFRLAQLCPGPS